MFATVSIAGSGGRSAILVPNEAVQEMNGDQVVFVRTQQTQFRPREVTTSQAADTHTEVLEGLRPGEEVVVKGAFLLKSELLKESEQ
jgi:multidrug efflux pump subunit AcrA (membrane-fusion protein)